MEREYGQDNPQSPSKRQRESESISTPPASPLAHGSQSEVQPAQTKKVFFAVATMNDAPLSSKPHYVASEIAKQVANVQPSLQVHFQGCTATRPGSSTAQIVFVTPVDFEAHKFIDSYNTTPLAKKYRLVQLPRSSAPLEPQLVLVFLHPIDSSGPLNISLPLIRSVLGQRGLYPLGINLPNWKNPVVELQFVGLSLIPEIESTLKEVIALGKYNFAVNIPPPTWDKVFPAAVVKFVVKGRRGNLEASCVAGAVSKNGLVPIAVKPLFSDVSKFTCRFIVYLRSNSLNSPAYNNVLKSGYRINGENCEVRPWTDDKTAYLNSVKKDTRRASPRPSAKPEVAFRPVEFNSEEAVDDSSSPLSSMSREELERAYVEFQAFLVNKGKI